MSQEQQQDETRPKRRWPRVLGAVLGGMLLLLLLLFVILNEARPKASAGAEAEALADRMLAAINHEGWKRTAVIRWNFADRHQYIWDRRRHWVEVRWGKHRAQLDLNTIKGRAWSDGKELARAQAQSSIEAAYAYWANDSFWLNPVSKLRDDGVSRGLVKQQNSETALLVSYGSGGVTPGDAYLWLLDKNHRPTAFKMWVSIIPIGGVEASWEEWTTIETGVQIATRHQLGPLEFHLTEIAAAESLEKLFPDGDPFAELAEGSQQKTGQ